MRVGRYEGVSVQCMLATSTPCTWYMYVQDGTDTHTCTCPTHRALYISGHTTGVHYVGYV